MKRLTSLGLFKSMNWIDGRPLLDTIEPYRRRIFSAFFDDIDANGRPRYNMLLAGRGKKNWKSADEALASLFALLGNDSPSGNQCYLLASDEDQAGDDLALVKKIIKANPWLDDEVIVKLKMIERKDGQGFLEILPAQDVAGSHGKTYRFVGFDEIHSYRNWDLFEAMQFDPTRPDSQMMITSYASIHHRPGIPLFDLTALGKAGTDPRMLFSWYGADFTTDPDFKDAAPEDRANPSKNAWGDPEYLDQQRRRLPAHKFRRLHLNLPGSPEGSAYSAESVIDAVERRVKLREPSMGRAYTAFVDMSGGSNDDATLSIAHREDERLILDLVMNQGPPPPFDPAKAVVRFAGVLKDYGLSNVTGDQYAGETFRQAFQGQGIGYRVSPSTKSELYEALEPLLNGHRVALLDVPELEQQALGLVWRGSKIDHPNGEHDDLINSAAGALVMASGKNRSEAVVVGVIRRPMPEGVAQFIRHRDQSEAWERFGRDKAPAMRDPRF